MKKLYLLIFVLFLTTEIYPQWVQTNGPYGGYITALAVSGNNIFAGTGGFTYDGGIYRSTNNGENWIEVTNGLTNKWINKIAIYTENKEDTIIFAGTQFGGVFRSTNWGESWDEVNSGLPDNKWITSFAFNGKNIFTGLYYGGVFISTDNGSSWTSSGLSDKQVLALGITSDGNLFAGTDYEKIFLSTNNGINWTSFESDGTNLFALTSFGGGVFLIDSGLPPNSYISSLAVYGTNLLAGTWENYYSQGGVYLSTNNGKNWTLIGLLNKDIRALAVCPNEATGMNIFAGCAWNGGVYRSTDIGKTWKEVNNGISHTNVFALASFSGDKGSLNILAGTMNQGAFLSTDNGTSWLPINSGLTDPYGNSSVNSFLVIGQKFYAGTSYGLFISTDYGTSWVFDTDIPTDTHIQSFASNGIDLFAGTYNDGIFCSTDNGVNWSKVKLTLPNYTTVYSIVVDGINIFAGTDIGGVFLSTDNGESWRSAGLTNKNIRALTVTPEQNGTSNLYAGTSQEGIFLSTDNGVSWTEINEGLPKDEYGYYYSINSFAAAGTNVFVGTTTSLNMYSENNCRIFLSTNNGKNWIPADSGLARTNILSLIITPDGKGDFTLYAGTGSGVWKRPLSEMITDVEKTTKLPNEFALYQNYPNPFNPVTSIEYRVGSSEYVTLKVYDVLGNEVAVLVNEEKPAGTYEVKWNASNLSSGVYFYQLKAGNFTATKKLLLLK